MYLGFAVYCLTGCCVYHTSRLDKCFGCITGPILRDPHRSNSVVNWPSLSFECLPKCGCCLVRSSTGFLGLFYRSLGFTGTTPIMVDTPFNCKSPCLQVGIALGLFVPPMVVHDHENKLDIGNDLQLLLYIVAGCSSLFLLQIIFGTVYSNLWVMSLELHDRRSQKVPLFWKVFDINWLIQVSCSFPSKTSLTTKRGTSSYNKRSNTNHF